MIALLRGTLNHVDNMEVIIECYGVGYIVEIPKNSIPNLPSVGEEIILHIHHHIKENSQELYGFFHHEDRFFFQWLIQLTGIGSKTALTIMDMFSWTDIASIVDNQDIDRLTMITGIGKKTAEKLFIEMKNKLPAAYARKMWNRSVDNSPPLSRQKNDLYQALQSLGYSKLEIDKVIPEIPLKPISDMLKIALSKLANPYDRT